MTDWPDIVNGALEVSGGFFVLLSVLKLYRDKMVRGVSWVGVIFFTLWAYWNLFYYSNLDQWWSFYGGVGMMVINTVWFGQIMWYLYVERRACANPRHLSASGNRRPARDDTC